MLTTGGRIPNLFIVGAPRCASTSMYAYLGQHPDTFMPEKKEPKFLCSDLDSGSYRDGALFMRDWDEYLSVFAGASSERYVGDGCVFNLFSTVAAGRIREISPDAKIIIMLREPVEQMYSFHAVRLRNSSEDLGFAAALAAEPDRREGRRLPRLARNVKMYQYRAVASYTDQVARYFDMLGRAKVHVIMYEEFVRDPETSFRQTLDFLGLDTNAPVDLAVANPHRANVLPGVASVLRDAVAVRRFKRIVPSPLRGLAGRARQRLNQWNMQPAERAALDPTLRDHLRQEFVPEIERLSRLLDRDLVQLWPAPQSSNE